MASGDISKVWQCKMIDEGWMNQSTSKTINAKAGDLILLHNASRNALLIVENNNVAVFASNNVNLTYSASGTNVTITNSSDRGLSASRLTFY